MILSIITHILAVCFGFVICALFTNEKIAELQLKNFELKNTKIEASFLLEMDGIKSEAVKEFAERLKENYGLYDWEREKVIYMDKDIDDLVKEMEAVNNESN